MDQEGGSMMRPFYRMSGSRHVLTILAVCAIFALGVSTAFAAPLSGTYTIGSGGDYSTIKAAVDALNANGISGNVLFKLLDATYNESSYIDITKPTSGSYTVTFKPTKTNTVVKVPGRSSGSSSTGSYYGIRIGGASNIIFDGSVSTGGTSRDLTIWATGSSGACAIWVRAYYNTCNNNVVKNCILKADRHYGYAGYYRAGAVLGFVGYRATSFKNNKGINNEIYHTGTYNPTSSSYDVSMYLYYTSSASGNAIQDNDIYGFNYAGIYYYNYSSNSGTGTSALDISGNHVYQKTAAKYSWSGYLYGIYMYQYYGNGEVNIHDNQVDQLWFNSNPYYCGITGIYAYQYRTGKTTNVYNNMVALMVDHNHNTARVWGIYLGTSYDQNSTINAYHNSVYISGSRGTGGSSYNRYSACYYIFNYMYTGTPGKVVMRNNIGVNNRTGGGVFHAAIYWYRSTYGSNRYHGPDSDYNLWRATGASDCYVGHRGGYGPGQGTNYATLADWQSGTGLDAASRDGDPNFIGGSNPYDLHIKPCPTSTWAESGGTTGLGVGDDIDGDIRYGYPGYSGAGTAPDLGADEGEFCAKFPELWFIPDISVGLLFETEQNYMLPAPQDLTIYNGGDDQQDMDWAATPVAPPEDWLDFGPPTSGVIPAGTGNTNVTPVFVTRSDMTKGIHNGWLNFTSKIAKNAPLDYPVDYNIVPAPEISIDPARLLVKTLYKYPVPVVKVVTVNNIGGNYGGGDMAWSVTTTTPWITLMPPASGVAGETFTMIIDQGLMAVGTYTGTITITAYNTVTGTAAINSPLDVPVILEVEPNYGGGGGSGTGGGQPSFTGSQTMNGPGRYNIVNDFGQAVLDMTVNSGAPGYFTVTMYSQQLPYGIFHGFWVWRYYEFSWTGGPWDADITMYYTRGEAAAGGVWTDTQDFRPWLMAYQQLTPGGAWTGLGGESNLDYQSVTFNATDATLLQNLPVAMIAPLIPKQGSAVNAPTEFALEQNYPNPFNPSTDITYALPEKSEVRLAVYDMYGREVAELVNRTQDAGVYTVTFTVDDIPSGTYYYRLQAGEKVFTRKMSLVK